MRLQVINKHSPISAAVLYPTIATRIKQGTSVAGGCHRAAFGWRDQAGGRGSRRLKRAALLGLRLLEELRRRPAAAAAPVPPPACQRKRNQPFAALYSESILRAWRH